MSRVAIAFEGDSREPSAWSGIPRNLADALEELGVSVAHLNSEPGRLGRRLGHDPLPRRLRRAGSVDVVLQLGSEFTVPEGPRLATYDDMTVRQARRLDHPLLARLDPAEIDEWAARQQAIFERAEACLVSTSWAGDSIAADYGIPAERIHAVGIGRNLDPQPVERDWSPPRFLFIGQDWRRKNGEMLLRAFRSVREEHPDATLTVVGHHPGVPAQPGVAMLGGLYLNKPGQRARMIEALESSTCLVLPSLIEPSAIVHLEAAAAGVPSIGTTVGGVRDLIGDAGRLVDPDDERGLAAAMLELADPSLAADLGAAAVERARRFTWPEVARRIATVLDL